MEKIIASAYGRNGVINLYTNKLEIIRKGLLALSSTGLGTKDIYIKNITGINIVKPTFFSTGYFQILMNGSNEIRGRANDLIKDENTIFINKSQYPLFVKMKNEIEKILFV